MVGSTGTIQNDGTLKNKSGGLYDKIVNGQQFAKTGRKYTWPTQMQKEEIAQLDGVMISVGDRREGAMRVVIFE